MEISDISIIEHVGGYGGMDYYDYGLAYGLGVNKVLVNYHTCIETKKRDFDNVDTHHTFGNLWEKIKVLRIILLFQGYLKSFLISKKNKVQVVHLHFFDFTFRNLILIFFAKFFPFKTIVTIHDVFSFFNMSNRVSEYYILKWADGIIVHNQASFNDLKSKIIQTISKSSLISGKYRARLQKMRGVNFDNVDTVYFGENVTIDGIYPHNVYIGNRCIVTAGTKILTHFLDTEKLSDDPNYYFRFYQGKVVIEEDVFIGYNVVIAKPVTIGKGLIIGANAVITKDVPPNSIMVGAATKNLKNIIS